MSAISTSVATQRSRRRAGWWVASLLLLATSVWGEGRPHDPGQVKAAFLFNFAKYVQWSERGEKGPLRLCVAGETPLAETLGLLDGRRVRDETIELRRLSAGDASNGCRLLFVGEVAGERLAGWLADAGGGALTVSDRPGFVDAGGMIELFMEGERVRFAVNLDALRASKLTVSSRLLRLARRVVEGGERAR